MNCLKIHHWDELNRYVRQGRVVVLLIRLERENNVTYTKIMHFQIYKRPFFSEALPREAMYAATA